MLNNIKITQEFSIINTEIEGLKVINPSLFKDNRGTFIKDYEKTTYHNFGIEDIDISECFETQSRKNVIRGMHFQLKNPQSKVIRVISGCVFDVVIDLRKESKTFGKWLSFELSDKNLQVLFIPKGCAHGFLSYSNNTIMSYKCIGKYEHNTDSGIIWNDFDIGIKWPLKNQPIVSQKDKSLMTFKEFINSYGGL